MKWFLLSAATTALPFAFGGLSPSKPGSIQGTWRTVEVTLPGPDHRLVTNTQPNLTIVTARHYSRVEIHADAPRAVIADLNTASADQLRAIWGPFVAEAGTYELDGNVLTMRPIVAKNPAMMSPASFSTYTIQLVGDTLWITPRATDKGPVTDPPKIKAVRVE